MFPDVQTEPLVFQFVPTEKHRKKTGSFLIALSLQVLTNIGKKYRKSAAQIALTYLIQNGIVVIPKTSHKERMIENMSVFDFELSADDMNLIQTLDQGQSLFHWYD